MPLRVSHRDDTHLQKTCNAPRSLSADRYTKQVVLPTYMTLLMFVNGRLIGIDFSCREELEECLAKWPEFFFEFNDRSLNPRWARLRLDDDCIRVACKPICDELVVAYVQTI